MLDRRGRGGIPTTVLNAVSVTTAGVGGGGLRREAASVLVSLIRLGVRAQS